MKKYIAMLLALVMVFALAACGSKTEEPQQNEGSAVADDAVVESDLAYVQTNDKLVVGITDFEPMDFQDDSGEWIGFDADMAKAFAETLGVDVEFVEIDWDNKILELNGKSVDCIWNGMTLTDEVTSSMDCGNAYCNNAQVVVVKADKAAEITDEASLADLTFAVEAGSAGEAAAEDLSLTTTPVQTQAAALMEVAAGTSDACIIDSLMAAAMVGEGTSYAELTYLADLPLTEELYGVGFRQGSDLVAAFNDFLAAAIADGTAQTIAETYGVQAALIQ